MCLYLFAPGKKLQIDYAAEAVNFLHGGSEAVFDILLTNHSRTEVNRLHIVYPHPILSKGTDGPRDPYFRDVTESWLDSTSQFNRYYETEETDLTVKPKGPFHEVTVVIPNPSNIVDTLAYEGIISGPLSLLPYEIADGEGLNVDQWSILSYLGWSVMTLILEHPLKPNAPRWFRFAARSGTDGRNRMSTLETWIRRACGQLVHNFEIAGPADMRHRIISAIKAAGLKKGTGDEYEYSVLQLHALHDKLLTRGIELDNTVTLVNDWRVNVFTTTYRRIDDPIYQGDIVACGPLHNEIRDRTGKIESCFQWKAGQSNVPSEGNGGRFRVRIRAYDIPIVWIILPWVSFTLALFAIFTRPDVLARVRAFAKWLGSFFS
jgi:hypothetical protein